MKNPVTILAVFLLYLPLCSFAGVSDFTTGNLETMILKRSSKFTDISFKVEVINKGESANTYVKIKALDQRGFELIGTTINEIIQAGETRSLTKTRLVDNAILDKVDKWEVAVIDAFPVSK